MPHKFSDALVCKLGTLAHNTSFTDRDLSEYTGVQRRTAVALVRRGLLKKEGRARYYPTAAGWKAIADACYGLERGGR